MGLMLGSISVAILIAFFVELLRKGDTPLFYGLGVFGWITGQLAIILLERGM